MKGNRIQELKEQKGISSQKLSDMLGISRTTLYNYESNKTSIPSNILEKLSKIFNVSMEYILRLDNNLDKEYLLDKNIEKIKQNIQECKSCLDDISKMINNFTK